MFYAIIGLLCLFSCAEASSPIFPLDYSVEGSTKICSLPRISRNIDPGKGRSKDEDSHKKPPSAFGKIARLSLQEAPPSVRTKTKNLLCSQGLRLWKSQEDKNTLIQCSLYGEGGYAVGLGDTYFSGPQSGSVFHRRPLQETFENEAWKKIALGLDCPDLQKVYAGIQETKCRQKIFENLESWIKTWSLTTWIHSSDLRVSQEDCDQLQEDFDRIYDRVEILYSFYLKAFVDDLQGWTQGKALNFQHMRSLSKGKTQGFSNIQTAHLVGTTCRFNQEQDSSNAALKRAFADLIQETFMGPGESSFHAISFKEWIDQCHTWIVRQNKGVSLKTIDLPLCEMSWFLNHHLPRVLPSLMHALAFKTREKEPSRLYFHLHIPTSLSPLGLFYLSAALERKGILHTVMQQMQKTHPETGCWMVLTHNSEAFQKLQGYPDGMDIPKLSSLLDAVPYKVLWIETH